ncbi:MAG: ATP synthase F1 subunit delta [Bacteroidaceae bacterium]|nr:ATP synthase F1 subunit delta [Bacteroidaceae bacterium]
MSVGIISKRYAVALLEYANSRNAAGKMYSDASAITVSLSSIPNYRQILSDPTVSSEQKAEYLENIVKGVCGQVSPVLDSFISLLTKEKRSEMFGDILHNYSALYRLEHNIVSACLMSAQPVDEGSIKHLESVINPDGKYSVEWSLKIDSSLIGGFKLLLDDRLLDASVKTRLGNIKKLLIDNNNRIV